MRAAVLMEAQSGLEVVDLTATAVGPHEVLVQVGASGLCHSDISLMAAAPGYLPVPMVQGHEGAGVVLEVGSEVRDLRPGDRVIASWVASCGHCYWCVRGQANLCPSFTVGSDRAPWLLADGRGVTTQSGLGTLAEQMLGNEGAFIKVETDLPDEQLALVGCGVATGALAAMRAAPVTPGASVAVFGCGGVGTSVVQGARIAGAVQIIAVDSVALKRDIALQLGATHAIDSSVDDPIAAIKELTGGRGVDIGFEAGGSDETATWAVNATRRGGTAICVGGGMPSVKRVNLLQPKTVKWTLYGDADPRRDFPMLVAMANAGTLDLSAVVSRRLTLDQVMEGFEAIERGEVIRSVVRF
jgi:S-(hydroxymethyl)glutathione dehydrogenase/alcohol dehydrogenase